MELTQPKRFNVCLIDKHLKKRFIVKKATSIQNVLEIIEKQFGISNMYKLDERFTRTDPGILYIRPSETREGYNIDD